MTATSSQTTLYRIEPEKNMRRFYTTDIQPNLFGGFSLMRNWGRIGTRGQWHTDLFDDQEDARIRQSRLLHEKTKRGYSDQR